MLILVAFGSFSGSWKGCLEGLSFRIWGAWGSLKVDGGIWKGSFKVLRDFRLLERLFIRVPCRFL